MKQQYQAGLRFHKASLKLIEVCDAIVSEYSAQGFRLTLRQLYYQLVARDVVPNTVQSYNNVGALMTRARMAGLIDWDAIEDRTRSILSRPHWDNPSQILRSAASSYHENLWDGQDYNVLVVVEKEALAGVLERTCRQYDVPLLPARGYPSATTLREVAREYIMGSRVPVVVLHLGDHDPSGIDMSRDLEERFDLFSEYCGGMEFRRIALNMDQIVEQSPPPNPAKITDSRYASYRREFGEESWELDALSPKYLHNLVSGAIEPYINQPALKRKKARIERIKTRLHELAENFTEE